MTQQKQLPTKTYRLARNTVAELKILKEKEQKSYNCLFRALMGVYSQVK